MTIYIRKTTWSAACIALAVVMLPSTGAFAMADGHIGGPGISDYSAGTGSQGSAGGAVSSHAGPGPGVVRGVGGHGRAKGSGWSGSHQHSDRGRYEREVRRPLPPSPYFWWGNPYPYCQSDQYGRQHCY
jgi:hypothetical protein